MGAGRRTETLLGTHPPTLSPNSVANTAYFLHLTPQNLASVVFGCKYATFKECMEKLIFGLPYHHISYVEKVQPGMPLFLFNYSDRKMHGVFEAVSRGELNINPNGWTTNGSGKTPYPAQVQVRVRQLYQPLPETVFKDAIVENYYRDSHFYFELDHTQTNKLLSLFTRNSYKAPGSIVIKPEAVTLNKDNSAISQHQEENDDGWIKPKKTAKSVLDAWHKAAPFIPLTQKSLFAQSEAREAMPEHWDDFVGSDAQPKAREATPEHWDDFFGSDVDSKVENNLSVAGPTDFSCYEWEAADSEKKESPLEKSSDNRVGSSNGLSLNPAVLSYAEKENKEPKRPEWKHKVFQKQKQQPTEKPEATADVLLPEAGIPLHVEKDIEEHKKAQHELEVLGKLKQLQKLKAQSNSQENVDVPAGQNSVHERVDAAAIPNNHISEWEKLARQRCLQEQTMLREEHEKLRGSLQAIDSSVAKVIQKNLELSAVAIAQMTQDRLELKRVLEEASMELGLLKEVDQLRKRNAVLELTQDQMASDLESLKCDMVRMSAQLDVLMKGGISVSKTMSIGSIFGEKKLESQVDSHKVYLLGGHNGESWLGSVDVFIPATYEVMPVAPMLSPRSYAAATVLLGQIYVFGGGNGKLWYETAETYDSETNEWFSCSPMSIKRGSLAGAALGDRVFALGGGNGQVNFSDVECYDPQLGMWIASTSMLYKRFGVAAAELEGALYAIGGYDGWQYLRSVERFDPREALWTSVSSMNRKRGSLSAAALGGKIYAVGGYDGAEFLSSVEFYEPRTNCWVEMETGMHLKRAYGSAAIVGNSLYMFGGFSGGAYIDMVERYRANIGWEIAESAVVGRRSFLAGAVLQ